jgi:hypothetical protein
MAAPTLSARGASDPMSRRVEVLGLLIALAFVAAPALFWHGGVLEAEAIGFFDRFWGADPVVQRILDSRGYDEFQSRELSYAIDFLDAQWVGHCLRNGWVSFIPPSAVAASLLIVAAWTWGAPRAFSGLGRVTAWLLLALYLSNFAVLSTMGICYRATKPLVAPLLLFLLLFLLREHRQPRSGRGRAFAIVATVGITMSLLDRQGFLDVATLTVALLLVWLVRRQGLHLALGAAAATAAAQAYNQLLGPWLIHRVSDYWPNMGFQRIHITRLLDLRLWLEGLSLLRDWTTVLFGSLPAPLLFAGGAAVWVLVLRARRGSGAGAGLLVPALVLLAGVSQLGMTAYMVQRHEPVTWIDERLWYFPLPFQALLLFGLAWGLECWALAPGVALPRAAPIVIFALVVSNVAHWPGLGERMESGLWFSSVSRGSAALKRSIRAGIADPLLDDGYRRFFFECLERFPRLAARAGPYVREGDDVEDAAFRDGRLFSWARQEALIRAFAPRAGLYLLEGGFWLRPGDGISVLRGAQSPHLLAEVRHGGTVEGQEPLTILLDLPQGVTDLTLLSHLPERQVVEGSQRRTAGFGLLLPFLLRPAPPAASP